MRENEPIPLTPNQIVAANMRRARLEHGWTQDQATERLEPHLGTRWSRATYSAVEHSVDSDRIRRFDADDLVALSKAFGRPITYFLLPPPPTLSVPIHPDTFPFLKQLLGQADDESATPPPEDAQTTAVAVQTPAGALSPAELLERLLEIDEATSSRLGELSASLSPEDRKALHKRLAGRETTLTAARFGDLTKHARGLRQLADRLEGIQNELGGRK
jgi:transcriptional regulator with XRE-family HTH domain